MLRIGEDVSEILKLVPAHFEVHKHRLSKYACSTRKDAVKTAPELAKLNREKAFPVPGCSRHVVVSKYEDAIPLSRLTSIYERGGVGPSSSTLCGWVEARAGFPLGERKPRGVRGWAPRGDTLKRDTLGPRDVLETTVEVLAIISKEQASSWFEQEGEADS